MHLLQHTFYWVIFKYTLHIAEEKGIRKRGALRSEYVSIGQRLGGRGMFESLFESLI